MLIPLGQSNAAKLHYIDCNAKDLNNPIVSYDNPFPTMTDYAYNGGVFVNDLNAVVMAPGNMSYYDTWHWIQNRSSDRISAELAGSPIFNN